MRYMGVFDRYLFKNLCLATVFITAVLAVIIFLTQSLKFLELVIESGAPAGTFWTLTFLAMPRFLEIIMPLSLMAGTLFIYNRMTVDSELIVIRSVGYAPARLARPALILSLIVTGFLLLTTLWIAPRAISALQQMRQVIKAQFSTLIFQEGIFNQVGQGLTLYVREREPNGILHGLMIHDNRNEAVIPSTIIAKRGTVSLTEQGYKILVSEGSRQEYNPQTKTLQRLNFDRYTIDLPESDPVSQRWHEPDERSLIELLNPDPLSKRDMESLRDFKIELHRRIISPLFAVILTLIATTTLLLGPVERKGQTLKIIFVVTCALIIQGLYIAAYNLARQTDTGLILMYALVFVPLILTGLFLGYIKKSETVLP